MAGIEQVPGACIGHGTGEAAAIVAARPVFGDGHAGAVIDAFASGQQKREDDFGSGAGLGGLHQPGQMRTPFRRLGVQRSVQKAVEHQFRGDEPRPRLRHADDGERQGGAPKRRCTAQRGAGREGGEGQGGAPKRKVAGAGKKPIWDGTAGQRTENGRGGNLREEWNAPGRLVLRRWRRDAGQGEA